MRPNVFKVLRLSILALTTLLSFAAASLSDEPASTTELGDDPFATEPVLVEIGERGYVIPRNYIQKITYLAPGQPQERVVLRVLWPGLEPLTQENRHHWKRREPDRQIKIHIVRRGTDGFVRLQNAIKHRLVEPMPVPYEFGLRKYQRKINRRFTASDNTVTVPEGNPIVLECNDATKKTKELFQFEPLCKVYYRLTDNAWLHYRFFMVNLAQWREIDTAVRTLVDSFRR